MKNRKEIEEQWKRIQIKYENFLKEKKQNLYPPRGSNERHVIMAKEMIVREIDSEFVYTVYGAHQEGGYIQAIMDDLNHDVRHFEVTFSELQDTVDKYFLNGGQVPMS